MKTDIIIIGKGITGLVMSFLLSKKRIPHILLGREEKQPPLALGETLPPSALPMLQPLGLLEIFEEHALAKTTGYHSAWGGNHVIDHNFYFNRPFQHGLKLNKETLLHSLETSQRDAIHGFSRLQNISDEPEGVVVTLEDGTKITGGLIVDATGRKRVVAKAFGMAETHHDDLTSFSCHIPKVRIPRLPHGVFVESFESGWGIVSELKDQNSVMTLYTLKGHEVKSSFNNYKEWRQLLENTQYLKSFLSASEKVKVIGGNANTTRLAHFAHKKWLAIGDAAMAFDPLSSHGITSGVYMANQAVLTIEAYLNKEADALTSYSNRLDKIFEGYLQQKNQLYAQEKRWESKTFWKEMTSGQGF